MDLLNQITIKLIEQIEKGNEPKYLIVDSKTEQKLIEMSNNMLNDEQIERFKAINPKRKTSKVFGLKVATYDTMEDNIIIDII